VRRAVTLQILAHNNVKDSVVTGFGFNGLPLSTPFLAGAQLRQGGTLEFFFERV
jgi:putative alpha-1,2-mannosidase